MLQHSVEISTLNANLISQQMNKNSSGKAIAIPKIGDRSREGDLFPASSIDEYAELARQDDCNEDEDCIFS